MITTKTYLENAPNTTYFRSIRRHVFRHMSVWYSTDSTRGGIAGSVPGDRLGIVAGSSDYTTISHELGHTLGLSHGGHPDWNTFNYKPHYHSVMNYAYDGIGFSTTLLSNSTVLNPSNLLDSKGLGSIFAGTNVPIFISNGPFFFELESTTNCSGVCGVDWNRDLNTSSPNNRAVITLGNVSSYTSNSQSLSTETNSVDEPKFGQGLSIVRHGSFLYVFYIKSDKNLYYRTAKIELVSGGNGQYGSCDVGKDILNTYDCVVWGSEVQIPSLSNVVSMDAISTDPSGLNGHIMVVYDHISSVDILGPNYQTRWLKTGSFNNQNGSLTWNNSAAVFLFGATSRIKINPELSWFRLNTTTFPNYSSHPKTVALHYLDGNNNFQWMTFRTSSSFWDAHGKVKRYNGINTVDMITGAFSPAIIMWPNRNDPNAKPCGIFPMKTGPVGGYHTFYCYNVSNNYWENINFPFQNSPQIFGKPEIAYHFHRKANGTLLDPTNLSGQFWMSYHIKPDPTKDRITGRIWISQTLSKITPPESSTFTSSNTLFKSFLRENLNHPAFGSKTLADYRIALYEDEEVAALKGAWIDSKTEETDPVSYTHRLAFFPFTDGTFNADLKTGNDFRVMERNLCYGLHSQSFTTPTLASDADAFCGTKSQSYWNY